MPLIRFDILINELTNDSFERVKYRINRYLSYYFVNGEDADRKMVLEKIGSFLEHLEQYYSVRDNDLASIYANRLFRYINYRVDEKSRAGAFFQREKRIKDEIRSCDTSELLEKLEDFTKIFICLYSSFMDNRSSSVSDVDFYVSGCDIDGIIKYLEKDIPELSPAEKKRKELLNIIPKEIRMAADGAVRAVTDSLDPSRNQTKTGTGTDNIYEPIHDVIETNEVRKTYTEENFCFILLMIIYRRILDFESEIIG